MGCRKMTIRDEERLEVAMGLIFCLMGKSSSGKDTVYQRLLNDERLCLRRLVTGTTRPIRAGECEGQEYHFYTEEQFAQLHAEGKIIESRAYDTVHGIWHYFTVADKTLDLKQHDYLMINTLEAYVRLREYFGSECVIPLYLQVEDGVRLQRALNRERAQTEPKFKEMCRRFLADEEDFSEEKLRAAQIQPIFTNMVLEETLAQLCAYILKIKQVEHG